jgi:hypothetical protein
MTNLFNELLTYHTEQTQSMSPVISLAPMAELRFSGVWVFSLWGVVASESERGEMFAKKGNDFK